MGLEYPPSSLAAQIDGLIPGVYGWFIGALVDAHGSIPVTVTSWWRSTGDNRRVGGSPESQHLVALAMDLVYAAPFDQALAVQQMRDRGLVAVVESDHVHVQTFRPGVLASAGIFQRVAIV